MRWEKVKLSDIAETSSGGTPSRTNERFWNGSIPWIKSGQLQDCTISNADEFITEEGLRNSSAKMVKSGTLVLALYGATAGKLGFLDIDAATNQAVCSIIPDEKVLYNRFLFYYLLSQRRKIIYDSAGGAQPNISQNYVRNLYVPLPPLHIQQQIADTLDKAHALRRKDRELLQKYDDLAQSIFYDMFGDPVHNERGWELKKFSEVGLLERGVSKHRPRNAPELLGGKYPLVQTGDIANSEGYITKYIQTYSELGLKQSRLWKKGTLCITIAANIAKTGILTFDACFPDSVVGFIPNESVTVNYVRFWLGYLQKTLEENAPESAQKNINLDILRKLTLPVPPIDLQNRFEEALSKVQHLKNGSRRVLEQSKGLQQCLLSQYFSCS